MSGSPAAPGPYGSAHDLPSVREMVVSLKAMKFATRFVLREKHDEMVELETEAREMLDRVDRFYERFGQHHWICHDHLPWKKIEELLEKEGLSDGEAEQHLVAIQAEHIESDYWWLHLRNVDGLRERYHLLQRAQEHYVAGRYGSCALDLVTVIDGFVNDFETDPRRGIHARKPDEMQVWDGFAGHHQGLTAVMKVFLTPIYKRVDSEVFEVYRHGMVHGTVVSYDNQIVATKAWNILHAVVDWAAGRTKQEKAAEPKPGFADVANTLRDRGAYKRYQDDFEPSEQAAGDENFEEIDVVVRARAFCEAWQQGQWGLLPQYAPARQFNDMRAGEMAKKAKRTFRLYPLRKYEFHCVRFGQAGSAEVVGRATIGEENLHRKRGRFVLRWHVHRDDMPYPLPGDGSEWRLSQWAPDIYVQDGVMTSDGGT